MEGCVYCYEDFTNFNFKCTLCNDGFYEQNGVCIKRKLCDERYAFNKTSNECQKCETNDC
jgi:hypothetical protein